MNPTCVSRFSKITGTHNIASSKRSLSTVLAVEKDGTVTECGGVKGLGKFPSKGHKGAGLERWRLVIWSLG